MSNNGTKILEDTYVPAGKYWVGDPCYTVPDHMWDSWLDIARGSEEKYEQLLRGDLWGLPVVGVHTAYGDGTYYDQHQQNYFVDSGMIGVVSYDINPDLAEEQGVRYLIEFDRDTKIAYDNGDIQVGSLHIDTLQADEEEEESPYYYDVSCDKCGEHYTSSLWYSCPECPEED